MATLWYIRSYLLDYKITICTSSIFHMWIQMCTCPKNFIFLLHFWFITVNTFFLIFSDQKKCTSGCSISRAMKPQKCIKIFFLQTWVIQKLSIMWLHRPFLFSSDTKNFHFNKLPVMAVNGSNIKKIFIEVIRGDVKVWNLMVNWSSFYFCIESS